MVMYESVLSLSMLYEFAIVQKQFVFNYQYIQRCNFLFAYINEANRWLCTKA